MDISISQCQISYRVPATGVVSIARFDQLMKERAMEACATTLTRLLPGEPVFVLRRVRLSMVLGNGNDSVVTERWGEQMARAIVSTITDDATNVVRFENQADFAVSFLRDLLTDSADQWYYRAFASLRGPTPGETIRSVLLENRLDLPEILMRLSRSGDLMATLAALDTGTWRSLWAALGGTRSMDESEAAPFFAGALRLLDRLDAWTGEHPRANLLAEYVAGGPQAPSWTNKQQLAATLLEILEFMARRGYWRMPVASSTTFTARLETALHELDWVDTAWLQAALQQLDAYGTSGGSQGMLLDHEAARPFFAAVLRLGDALDLWAVRPDGGALHAYMGTSPHAPDWQNTRHLAETFLDLLRFLARRGHTRRILLSQETALFAALERVLADLDWLDTSLVRVALPAILEMDTTGLTVRPPQKGPTSRQQELLAELLVAITTEGLNLDPAAPEANALRFYAWLVARHPDWAGEDMLARTIEHILAAWTLLDDASHPNEIVRQLRKGDLASALEFIALESRPTAARSLATIVGLGEPGLAVLAALVGATPERPLEPGHIHSQCAGVGLLLRAVLDSRLGGLLEKTGFPAPSLASTQRLHLLLLALGLCWGEVSASTGGQIDKGLLLLAGVADDEELGGIATVDDLVGVLRAAQEGDPLAYAQAHDRFAAAWMGRLAGLRLLEGPGLHLYLVEVGQGVKALIAGDASGLNWPFGQIITEPREIALVAVRLCELWAASTGEPAEPLILDEDLAGYLEALPGVEIVVPHEQSPAALAHRNGLERLLRTLDAMAPGRIGPPHFDLTVTLVAAGLMQLWGRWLHNFAGSSAHYILRNFIRRRGRLIVGPSEVAVRMAPLPLDLVIEMSGYMAKMERVPWLGERDLSFKIAVEGQ